MVSSRTSTFSLVVGSGVGTDDVSQWQSLLATFIVDSSTSRRRNLVHGPKHLSCIERREDGLGGVRNLGTVRGGQK